MVVCQGRTIGEQGMGGGGLSRELASIPHFFLQQNIVFKIYIII